MAKFEKTICLSDTMADLINRYCEIEPDCAEDCLGEDDTITKTVVFGNGYQMDIKCCGVQFRPGESNTAWTEAILWFNGAMVSYTEPSDGFMGDWELEDAEDEHTFIVHVTSESEKKEADAA